MTRMIRFAGAIMVWFGIVALIAATIFATRLGADHYIAGFIVSCLFLAIGFVCRSDSIESLVTLIFMYLRLAWFRIPMKWLPLNQTNPDYWGWKPGIPFLMLTCVLSIAMMQWGKLFPESGSKSFPNPRQLSDPDCDPYSTVG